MTDIPAPSPKPPNPDASPLLSERTPSHFPVTAEYVKRKLEQRDTERWQPSRRTPLVAALFVGITGSTVPVLMAPEPKWNVVLASVLLGASSALATFFGMKSSGPRR